VEWRRWEEEEDGGMDEMGTIEDAGEETVTSCSCWL
jgi:hypothetical protein